MKNKVCISCNTPFENRGKMCNDCKTKLSLNKIKNPKICSNCFQKNKPRAVQCIKCKYVFAKKKKNHFSLIKKWQTLQHGDIFFIRKSGGGPIYYNEKKEAISLGYRGKFMVIAVHPDGIMAYNINYGFCYIYMGPKKTSDIIDGLIKRPYKIYKKI